MTTEELNKKVSLISNFTWYQQYKFLNLNPEIKAKYLKLDQKIDMLYRYPLYLDFNHIKAKIKDIDFISREIDQDKVKKIKEKYGEFIFTLCGKSAELGKIRIKKYLQHQDLKLKISMEK